MAWTSWVNWSGRAAEFDETELRIDRISSRRSWRAERESVPVEWSNSRDVRVKSKLEATRKQQGIKDGGFGGEMAESTHFGVLKAYLSLHPPSSL